MLGTQKFQYHLLVIATVLWGRLRALSLTSSVEEAGRQAACPGEEVVFTCSVAQSALLEWNSDSFPDTDDPVRFVADENDRVGQSISRGEFQANLTSFTNTSVLLANMTSTLTVVANDTASLNGTVVNCSKRIGDIGQRTTVTDSKILYIAAPPTILPGYRVQQYGSENATIVVEWREPEQNGWTPVNYTVSLSGLGVSTTVTVRQEVLVLPYNMPLNITIVATNCAGSSDIFVVEYFIVDCGDPSIPDNGTIEEYQNTTLGSEIFFRCLTGFAPLETERATCEESGRWNPNPNCALVDCGLPQPPANGSVSLQDPDSTTFGAVVMIHCDEGLMLERNRTVAVCSESGVWIPEPSGLECIPKETNTIESGQLVLVMVVIVLVILFILLVVVLIIVTIAVFMVRRKGKHIPSKALPDERPTDLEMYKVVGDTDGMEDNQDSKKGEGGMTPNTDSAAPPHQPKQPPRNRRAAELSTLTGDTEVITYPCTAYEAVKGRARSPAVEPNPAYHSVLQASHLTLQPTTQSLQSRPRETASPEHVYETVFSNVS